MCRYSLVPHCLRPGDRERMVVLRRYGDVLVRGLSGILMIGSIRRSMAKAKEDAVRMTRELLLDYYYALVKEMGNFGLLISDI